MLVPNLKVCPRIKIIKKRELPISGQIKVKQGDTVDARDIVASAELPGDLQVLKLADLADLDPNVIQQSLKVQVGEQIKQNQEILNYKGLFGLFNQEILAPLDGEVEYFTEQNAHLGIRSKPQEIKIAAYISGKVVEVEQKKSLKIETNASFIQGIFGLGGENHGSITNLKIASDKQLSVSDFPESVENQILIGGTLPSNKVLNNLAEKNAKGLIVAGIENEVVTEFLGYELGLAITGNEEIPFTIIVLEGFGNLAISSKYNDLFQKLEGLSASMNGATQVRAGAVRPELIVSNTPLEAEEDKESDDLKINSQIKIIRHPYFGMHANVLEMPSEPMLIESGAVCRVLKAKLVNGKEVYVPRANVELI